MSTFFAVANTLLRTWLKAVYYVVCNRSHILRHLMPSRGIALTIGEKEVGRFLPVLKFDLWPDCD